MGPEPIREPIREPTLEPIGEPARERIREPIREPTREPTRIPRLRMGSEHGIPTRVTVLFGLEASSAGSSRGGKGAGPASGLRCVI